MKLKVIIPFAVAIVLAGLALQLGRGILAKLGGGGRAVKIVVATKELEPGAQIKEGDVALASIPVGSLPQGAMMAITDAVNRVVAIPVVKGQTIVRASLTPDGSGSGLQALVPPGMRAVTIEVNEFSGVGGLLFPGCRVDVVSTMIDEQTKRPTAKTIVQNAKVTAVGQKMAPKTAGKELVSTPVKSVTVIVTARDAMALDLASSKGRPRLILRGAADDRPANVGQVTFSELMGDGPGGFTPNVENIDTSGDPFSNTHASAKHGYAVQVISGGAVSEVTFDPGGSSTSTISQKSPERSSETKPTIDAGSAN